MLIRNAKQKQLAALASLLVTLGLVGCEGNNSSTRVAPSVVITPVEVNKDFTTVEWDANNEQKAASHAYRAITQNSMIRSVFTNELAAFDLLLNLFRLSDTRDCRVSGQIISEIASAQCFDSGDNPVNCSSNSAVITKESQLSQAIACQDGGFNGKYFDGFFNVTKTTDTTDSTEEKNSSQISAIGLIDKVDENGQPVFNASNEREKEEKVDYLFQTEDIIFFFDHAYESYINFSTNNLECDSNANEPSKTYRTVNTQGLKTDEVGAYEGNANAAFYDYTRFTNFNLESTPTESCGSENQLVVDYSNQLTATMESAIMGGGDGGETDVTWTDMKLTLGKPSGIVTLTHKNSAGAYTVTLDFNTEDNVTITSPNTSTSMGLNAFLALSKPEPFTSESAQ